STCSGQSLTQVKTTHAANPDPHRQSRKWLSCHLSYTHTLLRTIDELSVTDVTMAMAVCVILDISIHVCRVIDRFKKYKQAGSHSNSFRLTNGRSDDTELQSVPLLARSPSTNRKYPPLVVDKLEEEMNRRMADDNKLFREEFNALPVCPIQASCDAASKEENKDKNRYVNILPCEHSHYTYSAIKHFSHTLPLLPSSCSQGYQEKNKFIAAQGPKEETVNDFWRMIWEQNTATIVMVTNLKERKECKCAQYWPDQGCWTYGNIRVSVEDMMVLVDYTIRKFCIQQVGDVGGKKPQRLVTQFHFTSWPDFGVPFTPIGMLKFLKKVKTCNPQYAGPIVVHCSAGVGRTGTFIVIDAMLDMMNTERKVDVFGFVTRIRAQRCQMVQTDMQYVFIFQAMLEHYLYGDTELEVTSLESHLAKLYAPSAAGCGGMEAEFKKLTSIKIQNDKMRTGNLPANMKKNRVLQIIPYEFNRVIIPVKRGEENTDYVNASFIDGYRQKDSYMASQGPLQHTIEDFWRMIWEWRSCSIVMLTELEERGQEKCAQYWPSDGVMVCGDISIELKKEEESESYTVRDLLVTNNRENKARTVRQFHFHGWPEVGIPSDGKGMINIIAAVQKQQQQSGNHPITVHCSAGAGRTGTFCALSTVLERVKAEAILDVFQTVKSLRLQRPHMVQTLEQYEFCYKVVQEYIDAFSDYANFK
uniref:Receptor-type tyrosine-protein phosphatase n=1 Tax=Oncorhynchus kisutch TaxID=8019 RepID=A0A8C7I598_ONCKI